MCLTLLAIFLAVLIIALAFLRGIKSINGDSNED